MKPSRLNAALLMLNLGLFLGILFYFLRTQMGATVVTAPVPTEAERDYAPPSTQQGGRDRGELPAETRDFSKSNSVSILLGEKDAGDGLRHLAAEKDGPTTIEMLDGAKCRYLNQKPRNRNTAYLYFSIHPSFKTEEFKQATLEVEYFDGTPCIFGVHYDGSATRTTGNPAYVQSASIVRVKGSNVWQTARLQIDEPTFANSQNGGADFRLWVAPPEIYVRRVTLRRGGKQAPDLQPFQLAAAPADVIATNGAKPIDLTRHYGTPAARFDQIQGYPWRFVPRGLQTFGNVPVEIGGMICLWGASSAKGGLVFPEQVSDIAVTRKFNAMYLYHTSFSISPDDTPFAQLVFRYGDGTSLTNVIRYGTHVRDWNQRRGEPEELTDSKSKMVWRGVNSNSRSVPPSMLRFFITELANPKPSLEVKTIDLLSLKEKTASCILAMTTGPAGLLEAGQSPAPSR